MKLFLALIFAITSLSQAFVIAGDSNLVHVALVFDDGPFPDRGQKLLALFAREKIHVTFSLVATNVIVLVMTSEPAGMPSTCIDSCSAAVHELSATVAVANPPMTSEGWVRGAR